MLEKNHKNKQFDSFLLYFAANICMATFFQLDRDIHPRPGVIVTTKVVQVIVIDGTECNVIVIVIGIKVIVIELLLCYYNISITPKLNFI